MDPDTNIMPAIKPSNLPRDVIPFAADLAATNESQLIFQKAVMRWLNSDKVRIVVFDPARGRTGIEVYILIESRDGLMHFAMTKRKKAENPMEMDLPDDAVEVKWLDERGMQLGNILYVNRSDEFMYRNNRYPVTSRDVIKKWRETGGIDYVTEEHPNPGVVDEQLVVFAKELDTGFIDENGMKGAESYVFERWNAKAFNKI